MIDLSALTAREIEMINENPTVINGEADKRVCCYLRFSSDKQTEQSIEGQLRDCISFCLRNKMVIVAIYVDRAISAKSAEKREQFLQMIANSSQKNWDYVLVWKLDRFARSRMDSAIYKSRLKKHDVRVISATETISENPEGILMESILEGMAEFYSAELSQKVTRGMRETALKGKSVGGALPLGYRVVDGHYAIDPVTAPIAKMAFELYADGWRVVDICNEFNRRGYLTSKGKPFNKNSFKGMFHNKRYMGVYTYNGIEMEGRFPAIVDKTLFEAVAQKLTDTAEKPQRGRAKVKYYLSGKLFCGHCGTPLIGDSGTGRSGKTYHYYSCPRIKGKEKCVQKSIAKDTLERIVIEDAMTLLTDEFIEEIAELAVERNDAYNAEHNRIPALEEKLKVTQQGIANITKAIEMGAVSDTLVKRLAELEKERKSTLKELDEERKNIDIIDKSDIISWLNGFKHGDIEDEEFKRQILDLLIYKITVTTEDTETFLSISYNLIPLEKRMVRLADGNVPPTILNRTLCKKHP